jgi:hypothetical protein
MPGGPLGSIGTSGAHPPLLAVFAVYGGLILFFRVWYVLLRHLRHNHGVPIRKIIIVVAIWSIPLLVAPPIFSRDVYSYAGQGEMVSHHIDPYIYGTGVLGSTPFSSMPDSVWTNTPSPYGPTFIALDGGLTTLSGHKILPDIVLLRLLEIAGLALVIAATPTLARSLGRDPAEAILLGAGSPLALTSLIGGAHNDALMIGLLLVGLAVAQRFGTVPGIVLCALAAGVKAPAALGVVFLGWVWAGAGASFWRRVVHTLGAGVVALGTFELITLVAGYGWGWLGNSTAADQSFTFVTPIDGISRVLSDAAHLFDVHLTALGLRDIFAVIGLVIAGLIGMWLLWRSPQDGLLRNLGLTLLVLAILSPILWAWYVMWGILVLAPTATGRLRSVVIFVGSFELFVGATSLRGMYRTMTGTGLLPDLALVAALVAISILPLHQLPKARRHQNSTPKDDERTLLPIST